MSVHVALPDHMGRGRDTWGKGRFRLLEGNLFIFILGFWATPAELKAYSWWCPGVPYMELNQSLPSARQAPYSLHSITGMLGPVGLAGPLTAQTSGAWDGIHSHLFAIMSSTA